MSHYVLLYAGEEMRVSFTEATELHYAPAQKTLTRAAALAGFAAALRDQAPQMAFADRLVQVAKFQLPYVEHGSHELMGELLWTCLRAGFALGG